MQISVSEVIVRFMERLGIKAVFGMPGAHILPVYDGLYSSPIKAVLAKHEQGAAFMACGYSRSSTAIGACIATAGPGATNLITGIANAFVDKLPVLAITGEAPTYIFGKGGLQESSGEGGAIEQTALFESITVYCKMIERTDYLANVLNQAAKALLADTPGPVLLSIPYNVQKELVDDSILDNIYFPAPSVANNSHRINTDELTTFADMLANASHPVIIAGYGCVKSNAIDELGRLSEQWNIPVTSSLKGKGAINEHAPMSLGCLGVTTRGYAYQYITSHADLVIFLGAGFNERTSYVWNDKLLQDKTIIQVDSNPRQLQKVFNADLAVQADIRDTLTQLIQTLEQRQLKPRELPIDEIGKNIPELMQQHNESSTVFESGFELVEALFQTMERKLPDNCMIFDDNIIFAQNFFRMSGDIRYFPNSGISALGHAIPAAIGARFSNDCPAITIIGDGGFQMCCMEIMTAVNYDIPITIVLFNNDSMGLIRKNQFQQYGQRFINCDFTNPDYAQLARSFGIGYAKVSSISDLDNLFDNPAESTTLIDVVIDKNAFPNYQSNR